MSNNSRARPGHSTQTIHLRTWLAPAIPLAYIDAVGRVLEQRLGLQVHVSAERSSSGPPREAIDPLNRDGDDLGLMCSPPYRWLADRIPAEGHLMPAIHVFDDSRNRGAPVYFADVYVREASRYQCFEDLRGARFGYNDPCSLSGFLGVAGRLRASRMLGRILRGQHRDGRSSAIVDMLEAGISMKAGRLPALAKYLPVYGAFVHLAHPVQLLFIDLDSQTLSETLQRRFWMQVMRLLSLG